MPGGQFVGACYHCKSEMWLPDALYVAAKHSSKLAFYCAYGHPQVFAEGDNEETKLRHERDRLVQRLAQKDDEIKLANGRVAAAQYQARAYKASATRTLNRAKAGTCPCCKRTFRQMALHMKNKHPTFKAEQAV